MRKVVTTCEQCGQVVVARHFTVEVRAIAVDGRRDEGHQLVGHVFLLDFDDVECRDKFMEGR
jgi:hypothetical protein